MTKLEAKVRELGFPDVDHYLIARASMTFQAMADELGVSITTVTDAYRDLMRRAENVQ